MFSLRGASRDSSTLIPCPNAGRFWVNIGQVRVLAWKVDERCLSNHPHEFVTYVWVDSSYVAGWPQRDLTNFERVSQKPGGMSCCCGSVYPLLPDITKVTTHKDVHIVYANTNIAWKTTWNSNKIKIVRTSGGKPKQYNISRHILGRKERTQLARWRRYMAVNVVIFN